MSHKPCNKIVLFKHHRISFYHPRCVCSSGISGSELGESMKKLEQKMESLFFGIVPVAAPPSLLFFFLSFFVLVPIVVSVVIQRGIIYNGRCTIPPYMLTM